MFSPISYGRGSGDMKGGVVAAITALKALRKLGYRPSGRLHFETVPEEENTGNGALACCVKGYTADACIIPEPFADTLSTAQVGVMWMTVEVDGTPAHVLDMTKGEQEEQRILCDVLMSFVLFKVSMLFRALCRFLRL